MYCLLCTVLDYKFRPYYSYDLYGTFRKVPESLDHFVALLPCTYNNASVINPPRWRLCKYFRKGCNPFKIPVYATPVRNDSQLMCLISGIELLVTIAKSFIGLKILHYA